ncbi:MAG: MFS transporter [Bacillota bacterium]|nr:MFS transporter [Bacillota bacterium]
MNSVILMMTNSAGWLSAVLGARVVGGVLSSLVAGVVADRFSRKKLMVCSDVLRGASLVFLLLHPQPTMFLIISFCLGFFSSFFQVSFSAELPLLFKGETSLQINSLVTRLSSISMVVGFVGSGLLSSVVSYRFILALDAASFFVCALALIVILGARDVQTTSRQQGKPNLLTALNGWLIDLKEVKTFLSAQLILLIILSVSFVQTFGASSHNVGIPMLAVKLDPQHATFYQGIIWGIWGCGNILATMIIPKMKTVKSRLEHFFFYVSLLMSLSFILLFSSTNLLFIMPLAFVTGAVDGSVGILFSTILQNTENAIRGRVFGVSALINRLGFAVGFLVTPMLIKAVSLSKMVLIMHGTVMLSIIAALLLIYFSTVLRKKLLTLSA